MFIEVIIERFPAFSVQSSNYRNVRRSKMRDAKWNQLMVCASMR